jgi:hypothetical protein
MLIFHSLAIHSKPKDSSKLQYHAKERHSIAGHEQEIKKYQAEEVDESKTDRSGNIDIR